MQTACAPGQQCPELTSDIYQARLSSTEFMHDECEHELQAAQPILMPPLAMAHT